MPDYFLPVTMAVLSLVIWMKVRPRINTKITSGPHSILLASVCYLVASSSRALGYDFFYYIITTIATLAFLLGYLSISRMRPTK